VSPAIDNGFPTTTIGAPTRAIAVDESPPTSEQQLPVTGAADSLYWMALGGTLAIMVGLVLVARMAPRRR
jgi:LPXTG-motif cell wall-anchored protein